MSNPAQPLSDQQLLAVLQQSNDATAIHYSEDAIIQYANDAMLAIWGKGDSVIGKSLEDALPELKGQPFIDMFKRVWNEGISFNGNDTPAELIVDGKLQTFYFNFEYRAVKNEQGKTYCILHIARDVTDLVTGREREQSLTEELRASNEELLAANEEINASNEELLASKQQLLSLYEELTDSDLRFRSMVKQAPVGLCIINARDLTITDVNDAYLKLVGKKRGEMENQTIWLAVPESAEAYAPVMKNVIATGEPFIAKEHELILVRDGKPEPVFADFVYEPIKTDNSVSAIMVLGIDVTDKVYARRNIEEAEERGRLAVEAAEIGTFDLDLINNEMATSERCNSICGFDKHVSWNTFVAIIHPDDKESREISHEAALITGKLFYETRINKPIGSMAWIRVQGSVYFDKDKNPVRILGTLLDITQFKRLEQQKDDFISIASHELKTPITSLKASLQLLEKVKDNPTSPLMPKLIDQSIRSVQKITTLVDDLLNVSRTRNTQLQLNKSNFNIAVLLEGCCNHIRSAGKYDLVFEGDRSLKLSADEHAIDQVVVNLVNNAVKYAPNSLKIYLKVEKQDGMIKISVRDTGPGIAADKVPFLFDRYYQTDAVGFNSSGLGLGLYISAEIIRKHGGKIGVDSELSKGSTFWFTLPA